MKMGKKTLHDTLRPLIFLICFFGLNLNPVLISYNALAFCVFAFNYAIHLVSIYWYLIHVNDLDRNNRINFGFQKVTFSSHLACLLLIQCRKKRLSQLLQLLKTCEMSEGCSKSFRKFQFLFLIICLNLFYLLIYSESVAHQTNVLTHFQYLYLYAFTYVYVMGLFCLPLCAILVCVIPHYINFTLNERTEEVQRCKSPLRRARLTTQLILFSTQLNRLTEGSDRLGASLMFILRSNARAIFVLIIFFCTLRGLKYTVVDLKYNASQFLLLFFYLRYLRTAPCANQMLSSIYKVLTEAALMDNRYVSSKLILRPQLLTQRLIHLFHLAHFKVNPAQFTVTGGDSIDDADLFTVFAEVLDTFVSCGNIPPDDPNYEIIYMDHRLHN